MGKKKETKREKFVRLAQFRVQKLLKNMESIGKLANANSYEFTPEDVTKINENVANKWNAVIAKFEGKAEETETFTL